MNMLKKRTVFFLVSFFFLLNVLFAQDIPFRKTGKEYDFRSLLSNLPAHNIDILHYQFDWDIDFSTRFIQGQAIVQAKSLVEDLDVIILHLDESMEVEKITRLGLPLSYTHQDDEMEIQLGGSFGAGELFEIVITYQGFPQTGLNFSQHQNEPVIWSLDEPTRARYWFPCYDLPSDKATAMIRITVPDNMFAASNGNLISINPSQNNTLTFVWEEKYPIATYLISIAATNYSKFSDYYAAGDSVMEVQYYVYPEDLQSARFDFLPTVSMIEFYSRIFGEYPFLSEKYGMAEIPGTTAMEHQTMTSYPSVAIDGSGTHDWLIAHELAHHWWGDSLTPAEWADIWLNEGFATYSDALWQEHVSGFEGLKSRMARFKNIYLDHEGEEHPIYDPPSGHLFCEIEYEKGAWILHMLRFVTGEENYFKIMKTYAQEYAYSNVSTHDFQIVCEEVYGTDLDWFFSEWIYQSGFPTYEFGWGVTQANRVKVIVNQTTEPLFKMPIELQLDLPSGPQKKIIWVEEKNHVSELLLSEKPIAVYFDPDGWILCTVEHFYKKAKPGR